MLVLIFIIFGLVNSLQTNVLTKFTYKVSDNSLLISEKENSKFSIILFPGYGKNSESYINLCKKINEKMNSEVSFLIMDSIINIPFEPEKQADYIALKCIEYLKSKNINSEKIYFMGHSAGAYFAIEPSEKYGDGLIQLGCVLNSQGKLYWKASSLKNYSKSVLTLLGEKDGYLNYLNSIQEYQDISVEESICKPIVIEKNVNHLQMTNNVDTCIAKVFKKKDYISPLSLQSAHEQISDTIVSYLKNTSLVQEKHVDGLTRIKKYLQLNNNINNICKNAQYNVLNPTSFLEINIKNTIHKEKGQFLLSKPSIQNDGIVHIQSYLEPVFQYYSPCLWIKMKSQESLLLHPKYQYTLTKGETTAKDINKNMFETYLNGDLPNNIIFSEDAVIKNEVISSAKWINTIVSIKYENNILYIRSPVLHTSTNTFPRYAGMKYMKLLTPQLIEELMTLYF